MAVEAVEGSVTFEGYETRYRIVKDGDGRPHEKPPILMLHGGPGGSSDSFEPLQNLAETGRPMVLYDQASCGDSEGPKDPSQWTIALFLNQLSTVRRELGLGRVHLLGHSWGGMLAQEYALTRPDGLLSLSLVASSPAAALIWAARERSYEHLPKSVRETLLEHEAAKTFEDPEYERAAEFFYRRHVLRLDHRPTWWNRALERFNTALNVHMWAPPDGELSDWDLRTRIHEISIPTLVVAGRHDGATSGAEDVLHEGIPGSELAVFEDSSHYPFAEEPERFVHTLDDFLTRAEGVSTLR